MKIVDFNAKTQRVGDAENKDSISLRLRASASNLRVILWDIDGTLVRARQAGSFKNYFAPALQRVFGTSGQLAEMGSVSGMTDLQIISEALAPAKITVNDVRGKLDELLPIFVEEMRRFCLSDDYLLDVMPGVPEILRATAEHPNIVTALLTGNFQPAAELKLEIAGLNDFFDFALGSFGEESHNRLDLPAIAAENVSRQLNAHFEPSQFIVIGDTPNDIACAKHFGARAISVATGRSYPPEKLVPHNPDVLLVDLSDTNGVLQVLLNV